MTNSDSWAVPSITALAALVAALAAQWFRVWLDRRVARERLMDQLRADLAQMGYLFSVLEHEHQEAGQFHVQHVAQVGFLLDSYKAYEGQLVSLPSWVRRSAARTYLEIAGVMATLEEIQRRNTKALAHQGRPVPKEEIDSMFAMIPKLAELCIEAEADVTTVYSFSLRLRDILRSLPGGGWLMESRWRLKRERRRSIRDRVAAEHQARQQRIQPWSGSKKR